MVKISNNMQVADYKAIEKHARLQIVRETLGHSITQAAHLLGMDVSNYKKLETGTRPIGRNVGQLLSEKLGVSSQWLDCGEGDMMTSEKDPTPLTLSERVRLETENRLLREQNEQLLALLNIKRVD